MVKIGSHVPFTNPSYLLGAAEISITNGANAMMIYLGSPRTALRKPDAWNVKEYQALFSARIKPENIVVHAPYIINASSKSNWEFAAKVLADEAKYMNLFGAKFLVLHPGSATETTREEALATLVKTLTQVLSQTKDVTFLIETMAGKGNELGASLDEIASIITTLNNERVGVCLDTCHLSDAGYDIANFDDFVAKLKALKLLDLVHVIHINDTKFERGSHKDRHENIGLGMIGTAVLKRFVNDKAFENAIKILETPADEGPAIYGKEIKLLLSE